MDLVGDDPNTIEIGMELAIPCRDNMLSPPPTAFLALISPEVETTSEHPYYFVTKAGETPFVRQDNSGVLPDILAAALSKGGFEGEMSLTRPENTTEVLQVSSQPEAMLAFPWVMPNCENPALLSPQSSYLCENYSFSAPLYEITLGLFTPANSLLSAAESALDFEGKNICTTQFYSDDILRENNLTGKATVIISSRFEDCLMGLTDGIFDAVVADYQSAAQHGFEEGGITDIPAYARTTTLHAIAFSQNQAAMDVLNVTNAGLKQILTSGEWFAIVTQQSTLRNN